MLLLKLVVAAVLLYYIFTSVPLVSVIRALRTANPWLVIAAIMISFVTVSISAGRLSILAKTQGMSIGIGSLTRINLIARFYGLALPGTLAGGAIRWHRISLRERDKKTEALAIITYGRLAYYISLVTLALLFLAWEPPEQRGDYSVWALVMFGCGFLFMAYLLIYVRPSSASVAVGRHGQRFFGRVVEIRDRFRSMTGRGLGGVATLSLLENLLAMLSGYLLAQSLEINISFVSLAWIQALLWIATSIPVSVSGLGIREGGLIVLLRPYGVSEVSAVALAFLMLARMLVVASAGGVLEGIRLLVGPKEVEGV